jgi:hypothetical protein
MEFKKIFKNNFVREEKEQFEMAKTRPWELVLW